MMRPKAPTAMAKQERKLEFIQAILECQIDFEKLARRLGYKNERCAADSYYRFCREHLKRIQPVPGARGVVDGALPRIKRRANNWKQTYDVNGLPTGGFQDDEEEEASEEEEGEVEMKAEVEADAGAGAGADAMAEVKQEFPVWNLESFLRSTEEIGRETPVVTIKDEDDINKEVGVVVVKKEESIAEVWKW